MAKVELEFEDVDTFKSLVKALNIADPITFMVTPEKLYVNEVDAAKVAMVEIDFPHTAFNKFIVEKEAVFKVSLDRLKQVMKKAKSGDTVTWVLDSEENILRIIFAGRYTRQYRIALMEVEETEAKQPNIPFIARIKLDPTILRDIIKALKDESEFLIFSADLSKFRIEAPGRAGEGALIELHKDDDIILEFTVPEPCSATYPINYLEDMINVPASDIVTVLFASDMPLKLSYLVAGGGRITYYLAPRRGE